MICISVTDPPERNNQGAANPAAANAPGLRRRNRARNAEGEEDDEEEEEGDEEPDFSTMSKKEIMKYEKRKAKAQQREQEEAYREQRKEKEEKRMEALRERELEKEREFELKQQEAERLRKIEEKRLAEAYNAWKDPAVLEPTENEALLGKIQEFITQKQVVSIRIIAKEHKVSDYVCLKSVQKLIESHKLMGVINADGNVICVTDSVARNCSDFLQSQGKLDKEALRQEVSRMVSAH